MKAADIHELDGSLCGYLVRCPECEAAGWAATHQFDRQTAVSDPTMPTFAGTSKAVGRVAKRDYCCHVRIRDGQIEYLSDSTHTSRGKTRPLAKIAADSSAASVGEAKKAR